MNNWFVLYTKPRNEKRVASKLADAGFNVYCPMVKTVKQWSDRKKKVSIPLFNSYLFINIEDEKRQDVFVVPGVVRYLFWLGKPAIVREQEILNIKDFLNEYGDSSQISLETFAKGREFKVKEGPLKDMLGEVVRTTKNTVVLQITSLGMELRAELHHSQLV